MTKHEDSKPEVAAEDQETSKERREALKKLGRYAYAAPVVMSLLTTRGNAQALSPPPAP